MDETDFFFSSIPSDWQAAKVVAEICREYTAAWEHARPTIRAFLTRVDQQYVHDLVKELVMIDIRQRRARDETVSRADYLSDLPEYRTELNDVLDWCLPAQDDDATVAPEHAGNTAPQPTFADLQIRLIMDRYEFRRILGRGAFGTVYQARDRNLDRLVAIKFPRQKPQADFDRQRFLDEARAAAALRHPNIVPVFEAEASPSVTFISFAFVQGGTLQDALRAGNIPLRRQIELLETVALALDYAHSQNVVHCDIKPGNLAYDGNAISILDFGLAKNSKSEVVREYDGAFGTLGYMSPEQTTGGTDVTPAADQYSLGCMLFEMLTGKRVFACRDRFEWLQRHQSQEPELPASIARAHPELAAICQRSTRLTADQRYSSCAEFARELRRWLDDFPVETTRPNSIKRARYWCRRNPLPTRLLTALVLLASLASGLAAYANHARSESELARRDAELARKESDRAREVAVASNARAERNLAQSLFEQARFHGQRGEWRESLETIDRALALPEQANWPMRLHRLKAINAMAESRATLQSAVDDAARLLATEQKPDPTVQGQIELWRADALLFQDVDGSLPVFQSALTLGLPPAENAFARAMLADDSLTCLRLLDEAVEADLFDLRFSRMRLFQLMLLGHWQRALTDCDRFEVYFPDDPMASVVRSIHAAVHGEVELAESSLPDAERFPDTHRAVKVLTENLAPLVRKFQQGEFGSDYETALIMLKILAGLRANVTSDGFKLAGPPCTIHAWRSALPTSIRNLSLNNPISLARAAYALVANPFELQSGILTAVQIHQEGSLATISLYMALNDVHRRSDLEEFQARCEQALNLGFFFPALKAHVHYMHIECLLILSQGDPEKLAPALEDVHAILAAGLDNSHASAVIRVAQGLGDHGLQRQIAEIMVSREPKSPHWLLIQSQASLAVQDYWTAASSAKAILQYTSESPATAAYRQQANEILAACRAALQATDLPGGVDSTVPPASPAPEDSPAAE